MGRKLLDTLPGLRLDSAGDHDRTAPGCHGDRTDPPCAAGLVRHREAIKNYAIDAAAKTSYLAVDDTLTVGVALLEPHYPESVELYLIAVHPDYRGQGIGTKIIEQVEQDLRDQGVRLFQVKTVGDSFEHDGYAATRAFYRSCGFLPLEELNGISWDGPTVIMVKLLDRT